MLVEVRPLPSIKWHGKKGKDSFSRPKDIEVLYDQNTGRYATGLTEEEAAHYGKLMGVDLTDTFNMNEPHSYYSSKPAMIRLPNHTVMFNTEIPPEFVKVKNLKASKLVANSMREYEEGKWPEALFVIFDEAEEVNMQASKIALRDECTVIKSKMSDEDKANMVQVLSNKTVKGRSTDFINVEINTIITDKPEEFLRYAKLGREEIFVRAAILEALYKNVLTKEASAVYYMGELIGIDYEDAVRWFKDPNNQKIKVLILEKLNK